MIITKIKINIKHIHHLSSHLLQHIYNRSVSNINLDMIPCPYCGKCHWCFHAYYQRSFCMSNCTFKITITRIICMECGRTHSILPDFLVPYSTTISSNIIEAIVNPDHSGLDDSHLSYWKNKCNTRRNISYFFLCIISKRSFSCVILFPHDFLVFSCSPSYNDDVNNKTEVRTC